MSREAYGLSPGNAVLSYAKSNVESGRWLEVDLFDRSPADFDTLLSQGIEAPNHSLVNYLYESKNAESDPSVGFPGFLPYPPTGESPVIDWDRPPTNFPRENGSRATVVRRSVT